MHDTHAHTHIQTERERDREIDNSTLIPKPSTLNPKRLWQIGLRQGQGRPSPGKVRRSTSQYVSRDLCHECQQVQVKVDPLPGQVCIS
jgi:hypothetical protein